jgi:hypothetical protein
MSPHKCKNSNVVKDFAVAPGNLECPLKSGAFRKGMAARQAEIPATPLF